MGLRVARDVMELLRVEAGKSGQKECCGILLGTGSFVTSALPAANAHPRPQTHFEIDPQALINAHRAARAGGPQVLGYYHSHPEGPPHPSATDRAEAARPDNGDLGHGYPTRSYTSSEKWTSPSWSAQTGRYTM